MPGKDRWQVTTVETRTVADTALQKRLVFAWLDALRSGAWKQCRGALEITGEGNCCLGVACRIYEKSVGDVTVTIEGSRVLFAVGGGYHLGGCLPRAIQSAIGLKDDVGSGVDLKGERVALTRANDEGKTFPQIADIIEANAATLFVNGPEVATWIAERRQQST